MQINDTSVRTEASEDSDDLDASVKRQNDHFTVHDKGGNTRSGRAIRKDVSISAAQMGAIQNYFASMAELDNCELNQNTEVANTYIEHANVGAGIGGGFEDTKELKPMKYNQAINGPDGEAWKKEIKNEHERMIKHKVFEVVDRAICPRARKR